MTADEALDLIKTYAKRMDSIYGKTIFNEWSIISLTGNQGKILAYAGPRREDFQKNFSADLGALRSALLRAEHELGDFEFSRHGVGTLIEAFVAVGDGVFLTCNNTELTMNDITASPRWLSAQVVFVELSDKFCSNPVISPN